MCTNFTPTKGAQWVNEKLGVDQPSGFPHESYPGFAAPVVVKSHQTDRVACGLARFGLIPSCAKDDKISRHTYNARSETVSEKPSYRTAWRQRQFGLVLFDNFYEPNYESGSALRWKIERADHEPFAIACLWDRWKEPESGQLVVSFSMLPVNADGLNKRYGLGTVKVSTQGAYKQWQMKQERKSPLYTTDWHSIPVV